MRLLAGFIICFVALPTTQANNEPSVIQIGTGISPPYQYLDDGKIVGKTVDVVRCALGKESLPYNIQMFHWRRVLTLFSNNDLDMVFGVADTNTWASNSIASAPLDLEKWFWYSTADKSRPDLNSSIATVAGSNQDVWLQKNNYSKLYNPPNLESAVKMLFSNRVDYLLADETYVDRLLLEQSQHKQTISKSFSRFSQHHAYFSPHYISASEDFIEKFDSHISACNPGIKEIDLQTRSALIKAAETLLNTLNSPPLISYLRLANDSRSNFSLDYIVKQEIEWEIPGNNLKNITLNNAVSNTLRTLASDNSDVVRELFLVDQLGLSIAMNIPTTDYWQGDEQNFISVTKDSNLKRFVSDVYFDESTRSFQSQVSLRIDDPDTEEFLGVIVIGLSLEQVMEKYLTGVETDTLN